MVVELKYNQSADTAIKQIKENRYQGALSDYSDRILLVGINYDKESKKHTCVIENEPVANIIAVFPHTNSISNDLKAKES